MAFSLERFDIIKQNYDKTGLYLYHDTVGTGNTDPVSKKTGNSLAEISATDFFNPVADILKTIGAVIIIVATDGTGIYRVNQVVDANGETEIKVEPQALTTVTDGAITNAKLAAAVKVGALTDLTTTAKGTLVAAVNEVNAKVAVVQADSTAADVAGLKADLNALLAKLKTAKLMASA